MTIFYNQSHPSKSRHVWAWLGTLDHTLSCYLFVVAISMQKIYAINWIFPEILMIKESHNLIGRAHSTLTCALEFSLTSGLHRKTENHKIFHFRLLPAKKNCLKTQKTLFLVLPIFGKIRIFQKNWAVTFEPLVSVTSCITTTETNEILRKVLRTDSRTDGQAWIHTDHVARCGSIIKNILLNWEIFGSYEPSIIFIVERRLETDFTISFVCDTKMKIKLTLTVGRHRHAHSAKVTDFGFCSGRGRCLKFQN